MALTKIPVAASAINPPVQIVQVGVNATTIIYTVPAGRVFQGYMVNTTSAATAKINGKDVSVYVNTTPPVSYTFLAGTTVALPSASQTLVGVESDA